MLKRAYTSPEKADIVVNPPQNPVVNRALMISRSSHTYVKKVIKKDPIILISKVENGNMADGSNIQNRVNAPIPPPTPTAIMRTNRIHLFRQIARIHRGQARD